MAVRRRISGPDEQGILQWVYDAASAKANSDRFQKRYKKARGRIMDYVRSRGTPDADGHLWVDLGEEVEVDGLPAPIERVKLERRGGTARLNEEKAQEWLAKKGLLEECQTTITVLDEGKLLGLYHAKKLTDAQLDALYEEGEPTWALRMV